MGRKKEMRRRRRIKISMTLALTMMNLIVIKKPK